MTVTETRTGRVVTKRLDAFETVFQVAQLTVRRSLRGWRMLSAVAVVALPAILAWVVRTGGADAAHQEHFFYGILAYYQFGIAAPVVAMLCATSFPWPEADEGTLTYWFTSPVRRWAVLLGRYVAGLVVGSLMLPLAVVALALSVELAPGADTWGVARAAITATLLVLPAYLAVFQLVAVLSRHGLVIGVVFVVLENLIAMVPGLIVKMTLVFYVRSLLLPAMPKSAQSGAGQVLRLPESATSAESVVVFAVVTVVALGLSLLAVEAIEYRGRASQPA
jgi:ABC-type transport system involved in multi-copper enzyme maturation permease subunit